MTVDEKISWANGISNFKSMFAAFKEFTDAESAIADSLEMDTTRNPLERPVSGIFT
jgi:hypothetical protein